MPMHFNASLHFFLSINALPFFQSIALHGQIAMHAPHDMHFLGSTCGIFVDDFAIVLTLRFIPKS